MRKRRTGIVLAGAVMLLLIVLGMYAGIGFYYRTHFLEHATINGTDVSDLTAEEAKERLAASVENYTLTVKTREGKTETIRGEDIRYRLVADQEIQSFLDQQNAMAWLPKYFGSGDAYTMEVSTSYDKALLQHVEAKLDCLKTDEMTAPKDAHLALQAGQYVIIPEEEGNTLDIQKVDKALQEAVESGYTEVDLDASGCYATPAVRATDGSLKAQAAIMNKYSSVTVTYDMGGGVTEVLDAATTAGRFSLTEDGQPVIDRSAVSAWVNALADRYDTIGKSEPFVTSRGETVYVTAQTYGWQMNREAETEALYNQLMLGESATRTPVWYESAGSRGDNDLGNTYVEIDYTNQRLWFYKDGALLVETAVVTGNVSAGNASPEGIFCLVGKSEHETLKGEGYSTPVDYWMPFYGGVGIHDADSWRSVYGGDIYQTSGSHGCINTPTAKVAVIYQNIEVGIPIVCYSSGINYGYAQETIDGASGGGSQGNQGNTEANGNNGSDAGNAGTLQGDIVIIDGGSTSGVTENGVPYTGEDLQDVIIQ